MALRLGVQGAHSRPSEDLAPVFPNYSPPLPCSGRWGGGGAQSRGYRLAGVGCGWGHSAGWPRNATGPRSGWGVAPAQGRNVGLGAVVPSPLELGLVGGGVERERWAGPGRTGGGPAQSLWGFTHL